LTGPSLRAGHCSQGGELLVVNDELAALAATTLGGSSGLARLFVTARASLATSGIENITIVDTSLETEEVRVLVGLGCDGIDLVVDLGRGLLVVLVVEILNVLFGHLLDVAALLLGKETRRLSFSGGIVVVKSEADLLVLRLGLDLSLGTGFTAGLLFLLLLFGVVVAFSAFLAPVALTMATLLVAAAASSGAVLAVVGVSILTGFSLVAVTTTTGAVGGLTFLGSLKLITSMGGLGGLRSVTTATAALATFTAFTTLTTGAITAGLRSVTTTTATTASALTATLLLVLVTNALELVGISLVDLSLLNLHNGSLLGFLLFDLLLSLLDLGGLGILISKSAESVSFHLKQS
jgi:hypothetical protein